MVEVFLLRFRSPYVVRLPNPLEVVDSFTVLRSLMDVASLAGFRSLFDSIASGRLASSSLLPAVRVGDCYRLLAPLHAVPMVPEKVRRELSFAPLSVIREALIEPYARLRGGALPLRVSFEAGASGEFVRLACGGEMRSYSRALFKSPGELFKRVEEIRSRIDRLTAAADLFRVRAVMPLTELWVALSGPVQREVLESALKMLGTIGLGAARSRGMGKFDVVEGRVCEEDVRVLRDLDALAQSFAEGPAMVLGAYLPPDADSYDESLSLVSPNHIYGIAGRAYSEYWLPFVVAAGTGSVLWLRRPVGPVVRETGGFEGLKPKLIFNPLVVWHASYAREVSGEAGGRHAASRVERA